MSNRDMLLPVPPAPPRPGRGEQTPLLVSPDAKAICLRLDALTEMVDTRLSSLEGVLLRLLRAMADEEDGPTMTLDGEPSGAERAEGQSLG